MKKGTSVIMTKSPQESDIHAALTSDINLPKKGYIYILAQDSYMTSWYRGFVEVVQLVGFKEGLELNMDYFEEFKPKPTTILEPINLEYEKG